MRTMRAEYTNADGEVLVVEADGATITISVNDESWTAVASPLGKAEGERQVDAIQDDLTTWVTEQINHRVATAKGADRWRRPDTEQPAPTDMPAEVPKQLEELDQALREVGEKGLLGDGS